MKHILTFLLCLVGLSASAANYVTVTNTFTNRTVIGDSFTVAGVTVRFTNAPINNQFWIVTNNAAASATNVQRFLGRTQPALYARLATETNLVVSGNDLVFTMSGGYGFLTTNSSLATNQQVVTIPWSVLTPANQSNQADALIFGIGTYGSTNAFPANSQSLTNFLGKTNEQTMTRKTLTGPFINDGTNSGTTLTNIPRANINLLVATNVKAFAGTISNVTLTNIPWINNTAGGYLTNVIGHTVTITNLSAPGSGANSLKIGSGSVASGDSAVVIGVNAIGSSNSAVAVGATAEATAASTSAFGNGATAGDYAASAVGTGAEATAIDSTAIGSFAHAYHSNSVAIGHSAETTTTNQIRLGTSAETVSVPGVLSVESGITNHVTTGTNSVKAEVSLVPRVNATVISGYVSALNLGTNAYVRVTGASAAATNASFTGGYAGLRVLVEAVNPGRSFVLLDHSSIGSPASTEQINLGITTGGLLNMTNNPAVFELIHNGTEWIKMWNSN